MLRSSARILPFVLTLALVGACQSGPALKDISSVDALKTRFNDDAGKPRIVLLLSPT